jgi:hypothetical protein
LNIIDWAKTAKKVTVSEDHEARWFGFDTVMEHDDNAWIGVVTEQQDRLEAKYGVNAGNYDDFFERLTDAQVALWNNWVKPSHEDTV